MIRMLELLGKGESNPIYELMKADKINNKMQNTMNTMEIKNMEINGTEMKASLTESKQADKLYVASGLCTIRRYGRGVTDEELANFCHPADDAPAIYVGTYGKYNAGCLGGMWVDLSAFNDVDEFVDFCKRLHADDYDAELMWQDSQNMPVDFEEMSGWDEIKKVIGLYTDYDDDERSAIFEYWEEVDGRRDADDILEAMVYEGSFSDFAQECADEWINSVCSGNKAAEELARYFDYESFEKDLGYDYKVTTNYVFAS